MNGMDGHAAWFVHLANPNNLAEIQQMWMLVENKQQGMRDHLHLTTLQEERELFGTELEFLEKQEVRKNGGCSQQQKNNQKITKMLAGKKFMQLNKSNLN